MTSPVSSSLCAHYYNNIISILDNVAITDSLNISEHIIDDYIYIIVTPNTLGYITFLSKLIKGGRK